MTKRTDPATVKKDAEAIKADHAKFTEALKKGDVDTAMAAVEDEVEIANRDPEVMEQAEASDA